MPNVTFTIISPYAAQIQYSISQMSSDPAVQALLASVAARGFTNITVYAGDNIITDVGPGGQAIAAESSQMHSQIMINTNVISNTTDANGQPVVRSFESEFIHELGHFSQGAADANRSGVQSSGEPAGSLAARRAGGIAEETYVNSSSDRIVTGLGEASNTASYKWTTSTDGSPTFLYPSDMPPDFSVVVPPVSVTRATRDDINDPSLRNPSNFETQNSDGSSTEYVMEGNNVLEEVNTSTDGHVTEYVRSDGSASITV